MDVYKGVEHSDSEETDKSDSSDSEYGSDEEQKTKNEQDTAPSEEPQKEPTKTNVKDQPSPSNEEEGRADLLVTTESAAGEASVTVSDAQTKEKTSSEVEKESPEKSKAPQESPVPREKSQVKQETKQTVPVEDSDSERELVIDLGEEQGGKERKRRRKDSATVKDSTTGKVEGDSYTFSVCLTRNRLTLHVIVLILFKPYQLCMGKIGK